MPEQNGGWVRFIGVGLAASLFYSILLSALLILSGLLDGASPNVSQTVGAGIAGGVLIGALTALLATSDWGRRFTWRDLQLSAAISVVLWAGVGALVSVLAGDTLDRTVLQMLLSVTLGLVLGGPVGVIIVMFIEDNPNRFTSEGMIRYAGIFTLVVLALIASREIARALGNEFILLLCFGLGILLIRRVVRYV